MNVAEQFKPTFLEDVVGDRFGRYSKYIIQDRAIPDVRDGLKPVQRRILYAMYEAGNTPDKPYRKSAKTVGDVMGNYHPHGDASIYEGMVRMAQPWKMGDVLIDGHGNWGSLDDDPAAAMRYTEARLSSIAMELLRDIEKDTVPFRPNFDNTEVEPVVFPARFPNLLVNGVSGISSGFATEIPTHNLREIINACLAMIDNPEITLDEIIHIVQGPDFPTGGIIMGASGICDAYRTGKGRIYIRAKTDIEDIRSGRQQIIITEIPYQVVKSRLVTVMENIRLEKKVEGIAEVRDESGREGMRIVIELKKDVDATGILNYLFKKTDLQVTYNFNMVAIVNKAPLQLGIVPMLQAYVEHQKQVVINRTRHDLAKAEDRAHVLEGLMKALDILDTVIATIKASNNRLDAQHHLVAKFGFSERQADAILMLQLYRLTNLELSSLIKELDEIRKKVVALCSILESNKQLMKVIKRELTVIRERYGVDRRSIVQGEVEEIKVGLELIVNPEDVIASLSNEGYIKRTSQLSFTRSGSEWEGCGIKEGDYIQQIFQVNTWDYLLIFTQRGQYFSLPVHMIPEFKWKDNGTALVNVIPIAKENTIVAAIPIKSFTDGQSSLVFVTRRGQVKRTLLKEYETKRMGPVTACKVADQDEIVTIMLSDGSADLLLITEQGMAIRFIEAEVNAVGRVAGGVRGIQMKENDAVVAAFRVIGNEGEIMVLTDLGWGKRSLLFDYPTQGRGGKGMITFTFKLGKRIKPNGKKLVGAFYSKESQPITLFTEQGYVHRLLTGNVPLMDKEAQGRNIITLAKEDVIVDTTLAIPLTSQPNDL